MGFLMDAIADRHRSERLPSTKSFRVDLVALKPECRWTDGYGSSGLAASASGTRSRTPQRTSNCCRTTSLSSTARPYDNLSQPRNAETSSQMDTCRFEA